jgi:hypothetical protein
MMKKFRLFWLVLIVVSFPFSLFGQGGDTCNTAVPAVTGLNLADHSAGGEQWYTFSPNMDGKLTVSSCGYTPQNTSVIILEGNCLSNIEIGWGWDNCGQQSEASVAVDSGQQYLIRWLGDFIDSAYNWSLSMDTLAPGELCDLPIPVTQGMHTMSNVFGQEQWFSYTPSDTLLVTLTSCGLIGQDTYVAIYTDCGTMVANNDDFCGFQSEVSYVMNGGVTYIIQWFTYSGLG